MFFNNMYVYMLHVVYKLIQKRSIKTKFYFLRHFKAYRLFLNEH